MNTLKSIIGWIKPRWLRLAIGAVFLIFAIKDQDSISGFIGAVFLLQGIMNQSCFACRGNACEVKVEK